MIGFGLSSEFLRYLIIGALNAGLTFFIYTFCLYTLHINYLLALVLAFLAGNIFTFIFNYIWVFRPEGMLSFRGRFFKYLFPNTGTFMANLAALYVLVDHFGGNPFVSQIGLMVIVVLTNFVFAKYWAFRK